MDEVKYFLLCNAQIGQYILQKDRIDAAEKHPGWKENSLLYGHRARYYLHLARIVWCVMLLS
jgi:hypothetical protein